MSETGGLLRTIPKVDELLARPALQEAAGRAGHAAVAEAARQVLEALRAEIQAGSRGTLPDAPEQTAMILARLARNLCPGLQRVINATGVVLHTNLGRAPLAPSAAKAALDVACGYSNTEYRLEDGNRGNRHSHVAALLTALTGAEDALVVNNNAGAVMLLLSALAKGKEVVISRGELIEIGGSFRVPDIMECSGAVLREVGTTNRTRAADYETALRPGVTGALLKAHTSNYKILGFTEEVSLSALVALGRRHDLPVLYDLGSGSLLPLEPYGLLGEPSVAECVQSGVDALCFSGDKLLGGPQAGILLGRGELIAKLKAHPLARALRVDKMTLAALEATLRLYKDPAMAARCIPTLRMMGEPLDSLRAKAEGLAAMLDAVAAKVTVAAGEGQAGGGSAPAQVLPSVVVAIAPNAMGVDTLEGALRHWEPPIVARIAHGSLLLDMRTVQPEDLPHIASCLCATLK